MHMKYKWTIILFVFSLAISILGDLLFNSFIDGCFFESTVSCSVWAALLMIISAPFLLFLSVFSGMPDFAGVIFMIIIYTIIGFIIDTLWNRHKTKKQTTSNP